MAANTCWKQPIPTDLDAVFGTNHIARLIYIECLLHARNEAGSVTINGEEVVLQRGQCYVTVTRLAKILNRDRKTVQQNLTRVLTRIHNRLDIRRHRFGFVVTIQNYDDVIKMDTRTDSRIPSDWTPESPQTRVKESVKSEIEEKTVQKTLNPKGLSEEAIRELWSHAERVSLRRSV